MILGRAGIDLHTHSSCSDGSLAPVDLVERAVLAGVGMLALTDHDTIAGVEEARLAASRLGILLVPGVEISATWRHQSIHVLGLWIDPASQRLQSVLGGQAERRRERMRRICAKLSRSGLPGDALLAAVEACPGLPTRSHLAAALAAGGHVKREEDAFRKFLGAGKPGHVAPEWPPLAEVVAAIRDAGGIASMAHPLRYRLSSGARGRLLAEFVAAGGGAIEVITGANGAQHSHACAALARKFGLRASIGSDFHHPQLAWNPLGRLAKLPDGIEPVWRGAEP
ncbi:MAG: PHP domain-containing protein [Steroidobacteraceae bacterium]